MNDSNFKRALSKTLAWEGGFTTGQNQVRDMPTNMGIQQETLRRYNTMRPDKNFPTDVRDLTMVQATQIYRDMYWDNTKIPQIKHTRIQDALFDMNVMSGARIMAKTLQRALNKYTDANLAVDGVMGVRTQVAINNISEKDVEGFICVLQSVRLASMQRMANWATAEVGWTRRVMSY